LNPWGGVGLPAEHTTEAAPYGPLLGKNGRCEREHSILELGDEGAASHSRNERGGGVQVGTGEIEGESVVVETRDQRSDLATKGSGGVNQCREDGCPELRWVRWSGRRAAGMGWIRVAETGECREARSICPLPEDYGEGASRTHS
jgi:hypothetical protein